MHLFCTYLDTNLPSNSRFADGKSFTGLHFIKTPAKPGMLCPIFISYNNMTIIGNF